MCSRVMWQSCLPFSPGSHHQEPGAEEPASRTKNQSGRGPGQDPGEHRACQRQRGAEGAQQTGQAKKSPPSPFLSIKRWVSSTPGWGPVLTRNAETDTWRLGAVRGCPWSPVISSLRSDCIITWSPLLLTRVCAYLILETIGTCSAHSVGEKI